MITQANSFRIPLKDNSIHSVITSFPYYGLRLYEGVNPTIWGGDSLCPHEWESVIKHRSTGGPQVEDSLRAGSKTSVSEAQQDNISYFCQLCGAWLGCFGLEPSISLHVQNAVAVCREIKRVLRPDGVFFLNYGDSYATSKNGRSAAATKAAGKDDRTFRDKPFSIDELPAKNLCLIPFRVAIALQEDGWIVRSDIIWSKVNPMPESVTDRPTKSHEYIFMLTKSARYFYDANAIREPQADGTFVRFGNDGKRTGSGPKQVNSPNGLIRDKGDYANAIIPGGRNRRSVWTVADTPVKLRNDLTPEQKNYVTQELLRRGLL
jgi:DNA modification methylase